MKMKLIPNSLVTGKCFKYRAHWVIGVYTEGQKFEIARTFGPTFDTGSAVEAIFGRRTGFHCG